MIAQSATAPRHRSRAIADTALYINKAFLLRNRRHGAIRQSGIPVKQSSI